MVEEDAKNSAKNNLQENCTLRKGGYKQLSNEEKAARKAAFLARQEFREKRAVELAEKSTVLNEDIRQRLMAQPPKAQEVFWKIRESKNGKQLQDIVSELDYSQRTAAYGLASLTSAGLIKRAGKVTLTGVSPEPVLELDIATLNAMEGTIYSVYRYRNLYPKAIKAVSGGLIPLKKIVSHVFDFKDCIHAIEYSNDHKDEVIKGVIKF